MIDLTDIFLDALKSRSNWTLARTGELLEELKDALPGSCVDWEPPNENWGVILLDKEAPAYVCALAPIAFINHSFLGKFSRILRKFEVYAVTYGNIRDRIYKIDPDIIRKLANRELSKLDYNDISLDEIWFATVT